MRSGPPFAEALVLLIVVVTAALCARVPLLGTPGPEAAHILGVVCGVPLCLTQALRAARRRDDGFGIDLAWGIGTALLCLGAFVVATAFGEAMHPSCAPSRGHIAFLVLAAPVLLLQISLGTWVGRVTGSPVGAVVVAFLVQATCALWLFASWYTDPSFRVVNHLFVVVTGDLFRGAVITPPVVGYRAATLLFGIGLCLFGVARYPRKRRQGISSTPGGNLGLIVGGVLCLLGGFATQSAVIDDVKPPRSLLERAYSLSKQRGHLVIHADPLSTSPREVDAMLAEGTLWLERLHARLGIEPQSDIHVWLHKSRDRLALYTGARNADFALPWRNELHITGTTVPHPTFGHELVHVLAGQLSSTWLRVPSRFVVWQSAGVVEGLAMAMTPELALADGTTLTLREQAAALRRAGMSASLRAVFGGMSFWGEAPQRAYVAAGALVEALALSGADAPEKLLQRLYETGTLEGALGSVEAADALIANHEKTLDGWPLPSDAVLAVKQRYSRPSILTETCSGNRDVVAEIRSLARMGQFDEALKLATSKEPEAKAATLAAFAGDARSIDDETAALRFALDAMTASKSDDAREAAHWQDQAGDALWRAGKRRDAQITWERVDASAITPDEDRQLTAKSILADAIASSGGAERSPVAGAALAFLLDDLDDDRRATLAQLAQELGKYDAAPTTERRVAVELSRYILARQYLQLGLVRPGLEESERIHASDVPLPEVFVDQIDLLAATARARLGDAAWARERFLKLAEKATRPGVRVLLRDRSERAARIEKAAPRNGPATSTSDPVHGDLDLLGLQSAPAHP
jgi:hypothetical protein